MFKAWLGWFSAGFVVSQQDGLLARWRRLDSGKNDTLIACYNEVSWFESFGINVKGRRCSQAA